MVSKEVVINNQTGLHARPASLLIATANKFKAELKLVHENREANLKSIIGVMALAVGAGETVTVQGRGEDANEAVDNIVEIIKNNFSEK